jgi:hypothetical protein
MVVHQLGAECGDSFFYLGLFAQVDTVHSRRRIDVVHLAGAEVVEDSDFVARGHVRVDDVGADEPRSSSHQDSHGD